MRSPLAQAFAVEATAIAVPFVVHSVIGLTRSLSGLAKAAKGSQLEREFGHLQCAYISWLAADVCTLIGGVLYAVGALSNEAAWTIGGIAVSQWIVGSVQRHAAARLADR